MDLPIPGGIPRVSCILVDYKRGDSSLAGAQLGEIEKQALVTVLHSNTGDDCGTSNERVAAGSMIGGLVLGLVLSDAPGCYLERRRSRLPNDQTGDLVLGGVCRTGWNSQPASV